jgi:hypothetical protein
MANSRIQAPKLLDIVPAKEVPAERERRLAEQFALWKATNMIPELNVHIKNLQEVLINQGNSSAVCYIQRANQEQRNALVHELSRLFKDAGYQVVNERRGTNACEIVVSLE